MPHEEHLLDLLRKLNLEQKVRLLTGADEWSTHAEPAIGLSRMVLSDGPSGIRGETWDERDPALNLPSATALASTWDIEVAYRYGSALAAEARRKGAHVVLGPTINLHRSPLGGRHFEAYSEDPFLTARLAAAYVRGVQDGGVGATPKHYVANDFETERFTANVTVDERTLREVYLAAFEEAVVQARAWVVMSAYNSVNGATMTENALLAEPLCGEWGFDGVVVSDWWAVRTTEPSALARQDLAMPGPDGPWGDKLVAAVLAGRVPEAAIDAKVLRLLRLAARVGALDGFGPPPPAAAIDGRALARQVAADGTVLARNTGELPWSSAPASIAVIGHNALLARTQGGGSATVHPAYTVSPLDGLREALPDTQLTWTLGAAVEDALVPLPLSRIRHPHSGEAGVLLRYLDADGEEFLTEHRRTTDFARLGSALPAGTATVVLATRYAVTETATVRLGVAGAGQARLYADGVCVLKADLVHSGEEFAGGLVNPPSASTPVALVAGTEVEIVAELDIPPGKRRRAGATLTVGIDVQTPGRDEIAAAVRAAQAAQVAVVIVGTSPDIEREAADRATLALSGRQDDLVRAVAAANPRTIVVVNSGSPVTMPWRDEVAAVLLSWFGGQELGHALADILLGKSEPGGRLPTTWPAVEADTPILATSPVDGQVAYAEGVHIGYRAWLRAGVVPAYPFGHGLGYTTWELTDLTATAAEVAVRVRNTGDRRGKTVVQAYLSRAETVIDRPRRWLAGFAAVHAEPGESQLVTVPVPRRAYMHWDSRWRTEPGTFTVHVGSSVDDTPLAAEIEVS
jgi:beta-glucosidase